MAKRSFSWMSWADTSSRIDMLTRGRSPKPSVKAGGLRVDRGVVPDGGTCVAGGVAVVVEDGAGVAWCGVGVTAGTPLSATRAARSATNEARARSVCCSFRLVVSA